MWMCLQAKGKGPLMVIFKVMLINKVIHVDTIHEAHA